LPKNTLSLAHPSVPIPKFIGPAHVARSLLDRTEPCMNGVNSNHVNHLLSHGRSSNIMNIPCFHFFGHAPHLLMCYALDLDPEVCFAPNLDQKMCYAPYSNSDPKLYYAPTPNLEMCHAFDPKLRYLCTKSRSRKCVMHQIQV
jgi:hypothetical protein